MIPSEFMEMQGGGGGVVFFFAGVCKTGRIELKITYGVCIGTYRLRTVPFDGTEKVPPVYDGCNQ